MILWRRPGGWGGLLLIRAPGAQASFSGFLLFKKKSGVSCCLRLRRRRQPQTPPTTTRCSVSCLPLDFLHSADEAAPLSPHSFLCCSPGGSASTTTSFAHITTRLVEPKPEQTSCRRHDTKPESLDPERLYAPASRRRRFFNKLFYKLLTLQFLQWDCMDEVRVFSC